KTWGFQGVVLFLLKEDLGVPGWCFSSSGCEEKTSCGWVLYFLYVLIMFRAIVAIDLYYGLPVKLAMARYKCYVVWVGHRPETISYYVNCVIKAIALLRFTYTVLPNRTDPVRPRIRHDDRFYPYFKDAIGAIDGTYIPAHILKDRQARYRNRKKVISQNVMGVCGFDLTFHYVGVGFEGVTSDMTILRRAIDVGGFTVPLEYQNRGNALYKNMHDKFNHRHAQLRNLLIVLACCAVHNFIQREHGEDYYFNLSQMDNDEDDDDPPGDPNLGVSPPEMQFNSLDVWFKGRALTIRNDLTRLFREL
ncbi:hypothetical protein Taro_025943, partial [Colocasia esculenta]|nr:hypothetical protein [Colocasia esculenta]